MLQRTSALCSGKPQNPKRGKYCTFRFPQTIDSLFHHDIPTGMAPLLLLHRSAGGFLLY
ncbi:MAG: hypothetical protein OJF47_001004 [Nitrospira sp.]|jgi:hypothetical protein|nr:MAG: hypothetical protein OJF47_001004 [Nitrospira sp.]